MGTISNAAAVYGLTATGTPTKTNVAGALSLGVSQTPVTWPDANIAYSFKVAAAAGSDVATLTLATGAVAQTTGTPTITDGDGNDFEGVALASLSSLYGILLEAASDITGQVTIGGSGSSGSYPQLGINASEKFLLTRNAGTPPTTLTITFPVSAQVGDTLTVTIIGKSS